MKTLQDIKKIAVLGAGTMGPGIAQVYAMGGYQVTMWTRSEATREKAKAALRAQLDTFAQEGEIKAEDVESIYARVSFAMTVEEAVAGAKAYITRCMEAGLDLGRGSGPLNHCFAIPEGGNW